MTLSALHDDERRRLTAALVVLLAAAAFAWTAGANDLGLKTFDDCRYARKGLEMMQRGGFMEVTWAGRPDFPYPPLQFWLIGRAMAVFGPGDFAARFPSMVMALGTMAAVVWIGALTLGRRAGLTAAALLALTPMFGNHARRCMIDLPLCFWTALVVLVFLLGLRHRRLHALIALPLAAALLTKGMLGLLGLFLLPAAVVSARLRPALRSGWLWVGVAAGVLIGASWPVHHAIVFGSAFVDDHFGATIFRRVLGQAALPRSSANPLALLWKEYQPLVVPAAAGLGLWLWRRRRAGAAESDALAAWVAAPIALLALSHWSSGRYLFAVLPALALFAGDALVRLARPVASAIALWLAPVLLVACGVTYLVSPETLKNYGNMPYKGFAAEARALMPSGALVPSIGDPGVGHWETENVALWYWGVVAETPRPPAEAVARALSTNHRALLVQRDRLEGLDSLGVKYEVPFMSRFGLVVLADVGGTR